MRNLAIFVSLLTLAACNQHSGAKPGADSSVLAGIPVTTLLQASPALSIKALGRVDYDTRRVQTIAARVSGRIEKLYIHYRYQHVHMGDPIMDIYSPELVTAQQDLLFLLHSDPGNGTLIDAARSKLLLLGMGGGQLQQVIQSRKPTYTITVYTSYTGHIHEAGSMTGPDSQPPMDAANPTGELPLKEGMYVQKGQTLFQLYNTDQSWIILNLFSGHAPLIKAGTPIFITPETAPGQSFAAAISYIEPLYREGAQTLTARVYFDNSKRQLPIGSQVTATIKVQTPSGTWLPREAVLSLGLHQVVLQKKNGLFQVKTVQTGLVTDSLIQVTGGLGQRDSVAADAQYLIDSESFIKAKQ
jgi:membrane fusion protein, copper/silver efflux system